MGHDFNSRLYHGRVFHQRLKPKKHRLAYRVCSLLVDLDELDDLDQALSLFSRNRFNVVSFHDKDFGDGKHSSVKAYVEKELKKHGRFHADGRIELLCYPRLFGYVFNPLSVYYCYDGQERLDTIIYEVSNTFGERHTYLIGVEKTQKDSIRQSCAKEFYVSPFMEMDCTYHFNLSAPKEMLSVLITQTDPEGPILKACFTGRAEPLSNQALKSMMIRYPLMTVKVMVGIHWEALKLWKKGLKFIKRPMKPAQSVTFVRRDPLETKT